MENASQLFDPTPKSNHLNFFHGEGRALDLKAPVTFLKFNKREIARATGVPIHSVRYDERAPADLRRHLYEIATICEHVASYFNGDAAKTALWFNLPNPQFGDLSPRQMIRLGRFKKLLRFVLDAQQAEQAAADALGR